MSTYCFLRSNEELKMVAKSRLEERGLSILDLARTLEVSEKHLKSYFENGAHRLSQQNLLYMCYLLGIEVDLSIKLVSPPPLSTS